MTTSGINYFVVLIIFFLLFQLVSLQPQHFPDMLDLLPPPLDFDNHFPVEDTTLEKHIESDDDSPLNHSIFEFSDTDLSFDDLSTNFAVRMHF